MKIDVLFLYLDVLSLIVPPVLTLQTFYQIMVILFFTTLGISNIPSGGADTRKIKKGKGKTLIPTTITVCCVKGEGITDIRNKTKRKIITTLLKPQCMFTPFQSETLGILRLLQGHRSFTSLTDIPGVNGRFQKFEKTSKIDGPT